MARRFKFKADLFVIAVDPNDTFDPEKFMSGGTAGRVVAKQSFPNADFIHLIGQKLINIHLAGEKYMGGWIPARDSVVRVGSLPKQFPAASDVGFIEERYSRAFPMYQTADGSPVVEDLDLPLGDFIASTVMIWTDEQSTFFFTENGEIGPPSNTAPAQRLVSLAVVQPSFSVRIACQPTSDDLIEKLREERSKNPLKNASILTTRDAGRVLLTINNPEGQTQEFNRVYDELEKNDVTRNQVGVFLPNSDHWENAEMDFRYPPIPRHAGFNVFGRLNRLLMQEALGTLQVGTRIYPLSAPSRFELSEIETFRIQGGKISIPVQIDLARDAAVFNLEATSKVLVNGEPLTTRFDDYRPLSDYMTFLFAAIGALTGIVGLIISVAQLRRA